MNLPKKTVRQISPKPKDEIPKSARERAIEAMNDVMTLRLAPRKIALDFKTLEAIIEEDGSVAKEGTLFGMTIQIVQSGLPIVCYPEERFMRRVRDEGCPTCGGLGGKVDTQEAS